MKDYTITNNFYFRRILEAINREEELKKIASELSNRNDVKEVDTFSIKASQYNPLDETYRRKTLKERLDKLAEGIVVQRDMLSAFVLEHVESDLKTINKQQCKQDFERFKYLQDIEVNQLKEKGQLTWYIS